jgi:hypothetical protein
MDTLFDEENLESIYNILKGENKELTKATIRSIIEKIGSNDLAGIF